MNREVIHGEGEIWKLKNPFSRAAGYDVRMMERNEPNFTEQEPERAMLVGVILPETRIDPDDPLGELRSLAKTAELDVVDEILAKRKKIHPGMYLGSGKAEQIAERVDQNEIDCVVFDNDLTPGQIRRLEKAVDCKVVDRSELILDIFALHAQSHQTRLQVELAQLEYTYPRLTGMWTHLDRHGGGVGTRGPGERQIETDRRIVQKRVGLLKNKLQAIDQRKLREVQNRKKSFCVCLVGYTNAGKSTLMNRLTDADVLVADQLFATLETRTRRWKLPDGMETLLSDTVGFVRDLPHHLVASFRATLEEAIGANLLLHVADASNPQVEMEIAAVRKVLQELKCPTDRQVLLLNKTDRVLDPTVLTVLENQYPKALRISAFDGTGLDALSAMVLDRAAGTQVRVNVEANFRNGRLMGALAQHARIERQTFTDSVAEIQAVIDTEKLPLFQRFGGDFRILAESEQ